MNTEHTMVHVSAVSQLHMWWDVLLLCFGWSYSANGTAKTPAQMSQGTQVHSPAAPPDEASAVEEENGCSSAVVQMRACVANWCKIFAAPSPPLPSLDSAEFGVCKFRRSYRSETKTISQRRVNSVKREKRVLASSHRSQRICDLLCSCFSD